MHDLQQIDRPRVVEGEVNYAVDNGGVNRFHARNSALDTFAHDTRRVPIADARTAEDAPRLDREGFALMKMPTAVADFRDRDAVATVHAPEIVRFIQGMSDADAVVLAGPAALRFGERAAATDRARHSKTARLVHSDSGLGASADFTRDYDPHPGRPIARTVHHNIWRTFSAPPQDLPLALCDFRSVDPGDLLRGEAAFDDDQGQIS